MIMRYIKQNLAAVLAVLLALPALAQDFQYEGIWYTVIDPDAKTCKTKEGSDEAVNYGGGNTVVGDLVIPEKVSDGANEYTVVEIGSHGFFYSQELTSVTIPNSVTKISFGAFGMCTGLTSVTLSQSLTTIEYTAFGECRSLESIKLPEGVTSIGNWAFDGCNHLRDVILPGSLTEIGELVFRGCVLLKSIEYDAVTPLTTSDIFVEETYSEATLKMPNATLASVQAAEPWNKFLHIVAKDGSIGTSLAAGDDFQYEGVWYTVIDPDAKTCKTREGRVNENGQLQAGNACDHDLVIPSVVSDGKDNYTVIEIGSYGFYECSGLKSIAFSESLTSIGDGAFQECIDLTSIRLPEGLTSIGSAAFFNCYGLTSVTLPESLTSIGVSAFQACNKLISISLPESLSSIEDNVFDGCTNLSSVTFPNSITSIGNNAFHDCAELISLSLPDNLDSIGDFAFQGCNALTSVTFPASLASIGSLAFNSCNNLISVKYNAVTPIAFDENIFDENVYSVATLNTPNATLASVQSTVPWNKFGKIAAKDGSIGGSLAAGEDFQYQGIWYTVIDAEAKTCRTKGGYYDSNTNGYVAGNACSGDISIPLTVSDGNDQYSVVEIGLFGFAGCAGLLSVSLPDSLEQIGNYAFANCIGLTEVSIPDNVTTIPYMCFEGCSSLTAVGLPEGLKIIEHNAFQSCNLLSKVDWPSTVTRIEGGAFNMCALTSIVIPDNVSYIGGWAFQGNPLASVTLPASMETFEEEPFNTCFDIAEVTYYASAPIATVETLFPDQVYQNATLNTPNATLASVQSTVPWNKFLHIEASDGSFGGSLAAGEDFQYEGIWYTVIDPDAKTCKTKEGSFDVGTQSGVPGNPCEGAVTIPSIVTGGSYNYTVTGIGRFSFCTNPNLTSISIPETVTFIEGLAFSRCTGLTSVVVPESVTTVGTEVFERCSNLESVTLSENMTEITLGFFLHCYNLQSIRLHEGITTIGWNAFDSCTSLTSLRLPSTLSSIAEWAFIDCSGLTSIEYMGSTPITASEKIFDSETYSKATLSTPNATLAAVQATEPWKRFLRINAGDGTVAPTEKGEDFHVGGFFYTVIDPDAKTCKTKDALGDFEGNFAMNNLVIPDSVSYNGYTYTVTGIGNRSFNSNSDLYSITIPATVNDFGTDAFADCERLTSIEWKGSESLPASFISEIGNPNLLLYVDNIGSAPQGMTSNVVVGDTCERLDLTPGYPFTPMCAFTAVHSSMTKDFTQTTPIEGCAGWETIVLPFDVLEVVTEDGRQLTPFASLSDIDTQYPFWLYRADLSGSWQETDSIRAGIPYILSMPNNEEYDEQYRITGSVSFSNGNATLITPEITSPHAESWNSGNDFRTLWLPLTETEAAQAMGLNAGIEGLTDDAGESLAPGSAFHAGVTPRPLEAYVTRVGTQRALRIDGSRSAVFPLLSGSTLSIGPGEGSITVSSAKGCRLGVYTPAGVLVRMIEVRAGETYTVDNLTRGIYIVAGRKIIVK